MFRNDYILRQIEDMARFVSRLLLGRSAQLYSLTDYTEVPRSSEDGLDLLRYRLALLVDSGGINEAEELIFDELENGGTLFLELALSFYYTIAQLDDEQLEKANFTHEEITEGIDEIARMFGVEIDFRES